MSRLPLRATRPATLFPYTTLFRSRTQGRERRRDGVVAEGDALAQCDRRGLVVDAECEQAHGWRAAGAEGRNRRSCVQALAISSLDLRPTFYGPVAPDARYAAFSPDRKSVVSGKSVSGRVDSGGRRIIKKKK